MSNGLPSVQPDVHARLVLYQERCKGCGLCTQVCPKHLLEVSAQINKQGYHVMALHSPEKCSGCALCAEMCPDMVIEVWR